MRRLQTTCQVLDATARLLLPLLLLCLLLLQLEVLLPLLLVQLLVGGGAIDGGSGMQGGEPILLGAAQE